MNAEEAKKVLEDKIQEINSKGSPCPKCGYHQPKLKKCRHEWEQVDKEYYETDIGLAKRLIDVCQKCGARRTR